MSRMDGSEFVIQHFEAIYDRADRTDHVMADTGA